MYLACLLSLDALSKEIHAEQIWHYYITVSILHHQIDELQLCLESNSQHLEDSRKCVLDLESQLKTSRFAIYITKSGSSRERTPSASENGCVHNWCSSLTLQECKNTEFVLIGVEKTEVL